MSSHLVLIGPMGAGKTTIGKRLARELKVSFSDTDRLIEQDQEKKISEIFIEDGEAHFRLVEAAIVQQAIKDLEESDGGVLSLGGGAVMDPAVALALKNSRAKKIFLDISLSAVSPRVGFDKARPLLMVNPRQKWSELMAERRPTYESLADLKIEVSELSESQVTSKIIGEL